MSVATEKMPVECPQCGKQLQVPVAAGGKNGRCPQCSHVFMLPAWMAEIEDDELPELAPLSYAPPAYTPGDYQLPAFSPQTPLAYPPAANVPGGYPQAANPFQPSAPTPAVAPAAQPDKYNHAFGLEQRAFDAGILGGLGLMALSVVWFVGGLFFDIIFYYPPILFLVGLAALVRGIYRTLTGAGNSPAS